MTSLCSICIAILGMWYMYASVYGVEEFQVFLKWKWTSDLEVDSRPSLRAVTSLLMLVFTPFRSLFLRPVVSGSHLFDVVLEYRYADFSGIFSRNVPVFCATWLDSGYMLRQFAVSVWQQRQVRTVQTVPGFGLSARSHLPSPMKKWPRSLLTTMVWLVLLVTMHLALSLRQLHVQGCSRFSRCVPFAFTQAQDLRHHEGYGREGQWFVYKTVEFPQVQFLEKLRPLLRTCSFMVQTVFTLSGGVAVAALDTVVDILVVALGILLTRWSTSLLTLRRYPAVILDS